MTSPITCASFALIGTAIYATGRGKMLLGAIRAAVYSRAAWYMALSMAEGVWLRLQRWSECVERSRREI